MHQKQKDEIMIHIFIFMFILVQTLEGYIFHKHRQLLLSLSNNSLIIPRQFLVFFWNITALYNIVSAIIFYDIGRMFLFYSAFLFICHRRIQQFGIFEFNTVIMITWITYIFIFLLSLPVAYNVYSFMVKHNFRKIGASLKLINAFVIRYVLQSTRKIYFLHLYLFLLYKIYPNLSSSAMNSYHYGFRLYWFPFIICTMYNEDDENIIRKLFDILLWCVMTCRMVVKCIYICIVKGVPSYIIETYILFVLVLYCFLTIVDFNLYGSGLKEFLKNRRRNYIERQSFD